MEGSYGVFAFHCPVYRFSGGETDTSVVFVHSEACRGKARIEGRKRKIKKEGEKCCSQD